MKKIMLIVFVLMLVNQSFFGQQKRIIKFTERLKINTFIEGIPWGFCMDEQGHFFIPDPAVGYVKILKRNNNILELHKTLGRRGAFDINKKEIFIYETNRFGQYILKHKVYCPYLLYDFKFHEKYLYISGYLSRNDSEPYDLYAVPLNSGREICDWKYHNPLKDWTYFILRSHQKYGLRDISEYFKEYRGKHFFKVIGLNAFFDIHEYNLYYIYTGKLNILKMKLFTGDKVKVIPGKSRYYKKPLANKSLIQSWIMKDLEGYRNGLLKYSLVKFLFVNKSNIYVIFNGPEAKFFIQKYDLSGDFISEQLLNERLSQTFWFDKDGNDLYTLHENKSTYYITRYSILD